MEKDKKQRKRGELYYEGVAFAGVEGELLVVHGVGVELGEGIGGGAEGGIEGPIDLVEAGCDGLALLRHSGIVEREFGVVP